MKILGMRVVGHHASSAIQAVALLISMDKGIEELAECVHRIHRLLKVYRNACECYWVSLCLSQKL